MGKGMDEDRGETASRKRTSVKRITRNKILIGVIFLGLANFATYTFFYWHFQGDARNGFIAFERPDPSAGVGVEASEPVACYYLKGHFIRSRDGRASAPVSRSVWIYSFIHSISIWPTIGGVLISMLILARPHIISTIKSESLVGGRTIVFAFMTIVILGTLVSTAVFVINLIQALNAAAEGRNFGI